MGRSGYCEAHPLTADPKWPNVQRWRVRASVGRCLEALRLGGDLSHRRTFQLRDWMIQEDTEGVLDVLRRDNVATALKKSSRLRFQRGGFCRPSRRSESATRSLGNFEATTRVSTRFRQHLVLYRFFRVMRERGRVKGLQGARCLDAGVWAN